MRIRFIILAVVIFGIFLILDSTMSTFLKGYNQRTHPIAPQTAAGWARELQNVSNPTRRSRAADSLSKFGADAVPVILPCLHHQDERVRVSACIALARFGPTARMAVPDLAQLAQQPNEPARQHAIEALGSIGVNRTSVVDVLRAAARDSDVSIRQAAALVIVRGGDSAIPAIVEILTGDDPPSRMSAIEGLTRTATQSVDVCEALMPLTTVDDPETRDAVFAAISAQGTVALPYLSKLLSESRTELRVQAATTLCRMRAKSQVAEAELLCALGDPDPNVRFWSLRALGQLQLESTSARNDILATVDDPDADVRWQAQETIERLGLGESTLVIHHDPTTRRR